MIFKKYLSGLRNVFWPIYGRLETVKFITLFLMYVSSIVSYTIVRILKDTYILSAPHSSANSISFVKMYFVLPVSFLYLMFFYWLTNRMSKDKVFFVSVLPLIVFFSLFAFVLLPNISYFHMSADNVLYYQELYPRLRNLIPVVGYWLFSVFYVFAELIGTVVITFLFWGLANYSVSLDESKRFFTLFSLYSYFAYMGAAVFQKRIFKNAAKFVKGSKEYYDAVFVSFYIVIGTLILFLALCYFMNNYVLNSDESSEFSKTLKSKPKQSISLSQSMKTVLSSKYLLAIVAVIVCYGVVTNLVEITWKEIVRQYYNGSEDLIGQTLSDAYFWTGFFVVTMGLLNRLFLHFFGWFFATIFLPIALFIVSFLFFGLVVFGSYIPSMFLLGVGATYLSMQLGLILLNLGKGGRYSILDPNIQMAYLPLDDELKLKGKAAVDIIGSRVGKSLGSFLESTLSIIFKGADQISLSPVFMPVVLLGCGIWGISILYLSQSYENLLKNDNIKKDESI